MAIAVNGSKAAADGPGRRLRIPLSLKFATARVALALLLLALGSAAGLWWAYDNAQRSAFSAERQKAETLAGRIGAAVSELQSQIAWTTQPAWTSAGNHSLARTSIPWRTSSLSESLRPCSVTRLACAAFGMCCV